MIECSYCHAENPDEEHRCWKCEGRLDAPRLDPRTAAVPKALSKEQPDLGPRPRAGGFQPSLFGLHETPKVVAIRPAGHEEAATRKPAPAARPKRTPVENRQTEFLLLAPRGPRTLKTSVEAVIYCDAKPASWRARVTAALLDAGMIAVGLAILAGICHYRCGAMALDRHTAPFFIGLGAAIVLFYDGLWWLAGGETAGMQWVHLRLLNFDGHRPEPGQLLLWYACSYLSLLAAGAGLLWSLVDEEHLTWHDHIAKVFPTVHRPRKTPFHRG